MKGNKITINIFIQKQFPLLNYVISAVLLVTGEARASRGTFCRKNRRNRLINMGDIAVFFYFRGTLRIETLKFASPAFTEHFDWSLRSRA